MNLFSVPQTYFKMLAYLKALALLIFFIVTRAHAQHQYPQCVVGDPQEVCASDGQVSLDGSGSFSRQGRVLTYHWETNCPGGSFDDASSATPTLFYTAPDSSSLPLSCQGQLVIEEEHPDGSLCADACLSMITIVDCSSPDPVGPECDGEAALSLECLQCSTTDVTPIQIELDGNLSAQAQLINRVSRKLLRIASRNDAAKSLRKFVKENKSKTLENQLAGWAEIWSIPSLALSCVDIANVCEKSSTLAEQTGIVERANDMQKLLRKSVRKLRKFRLGRSGKAGGKLLKEGKILLQSSELLSGELPGTISSCPNGS